MRVERRLRSELSQVGFLSFAPTILARSRDNLHAVDTDPRPGLDSAGKTLTDYPRPSLAVDTAALAVNPDHVLCVLLVRPTGGHNNGPWELPGTLLHPEETLAQAALRALADKASVNGRAPSQLHVLDDPHRDDRGWVLSVAHLDVIPWAHIATLQRPPEAVQLTPITEAHRLAYDHHRIVTMAAERLRTEYAATPDPRHILDEPFTLLQLQRLHEAINDQPLPKDSFRRSMQPHLKPTGHVHTGVVGKPARLFTRT